MAINFVTGLPRAGKTLWCIQHVKALAEKHGRQVYTCNIPDVTIPGWLAIAHPDDWLDKVPDSAIVVVDELQDFWGLNNAGSKVPLPILELSKHGKRGIDFFFITQEPELVHRTPRALCAKHYFVSRVLGTQNAFVYSFDRMQAHPEKVKSKGEKAPWRYPVEAFGRVDAKTGVVIEPAWYKSADVHNVKREIPRKLLALPLFIAIAAGSIYGAWYFYGRSLDKAKGGASPAAAAPAGAASGVVGLPGAFSGSVGPGGSVARPLQTAAQYVASYVPRMPGLPHTAPVYDQLTQAKRAPLPAACVVSASRGCRCFTQSATPYPADEKLCRQIVAYGIFLDFVPDAGMGGAAGAPGAPGGPGHGPAGAGVPGYAVAPVSGGAGVRNAPAVPGPTSGYLVGAGGSSPYGGAVAVASYSYASTMGAVSDYQRAEISQAAAAEEAARTGDVLRTIRGAQRPSLPGDN